MKGKNLLGRIADGNNRAAIALVCIYNIIDKPNATVVKDSSGIKAN